jgi:hypothetical protein
MTCGAKPKMRKYKRPKPTDIDPEFGITYAEVEQLSKLLDNADYTEVNKNDPKLHVLGRKVLNHVRNKKG